MRNSLSCYSAIPSASRSLGPYVHAHLFELLLDLEASNILCDPKSVSIQAALVGGMRGAGIFRTRAYNLAPSAAARRIVSKLTCQIWLMKYDMR
jgi:hypothetical protein